MTVFLAFWIAGQAGVSVAAPTADAREEIACAPASAASPGAPTTSAAAHACR